MFDSILHLLSSTFRFNLHGVLSVSSGLLTLGLGCFVLYKDSKAKVNQAFFLFTVSAAIWIVSYGLISLVQNPNDGIFCNRLAYIFGVPFIAVHSYLFCLRLSNSIVSRKMFILAYCWASIVSIWMIEGSARITCVLDHPWGRYGSWNRTWEGMGHFIFLIIPFYYFSIRGFFRLYEAYLKSNSKPNKIQNRNCLIALLLAYTGSVDFVTGNQINIYPIGYLSLTAFSCFMAYTIVRHQILNIKIVLKRITLIFLIYAVLIMIVLPLSLPLIRLLQESRAHSLVYVFLLASVMSVIFSFGPFIYVYLVRRSFWLKTHLTQGLTHELKSPLGAIQGAVGIIREQLMASSLRDERPMEYLSMIDRNVVRMNAFVRDLLSIANIQEGDIRLDRSTVDMEWLVHDAIESHRLAARQKNIGIQMNSTGAVMISVDEGKIRQILSNLISNAIKYSDGGVIVVTLEQGTTDITCSVQDNGRGLDPAQMNKIFQRFYQVSPTSQGAGLGLAITKAWVQAHGGRIWAESAGVGKGTTMVFTVPKA